MISHRNGGEVRICDGCYRPKRTGEEDWTHYKGGGLPQSTAQVPEKQAVPAGPDNPLIEYVQPEQGRDYCSACSPAPHSNGHREYPQAAAS